MSPLPQTTGNALINCINAAHKKYELNAMCWQMLIEIGWRLFTRADMERFEQMCEDGLLGPSNYGIFEDWLAVDRSRDGYLHIKDGLVLEGEIQEMEDKDNHYNRGCTRPVSMHSTWRTIKCAPIIGGSCSL
jgi:hypothetical protein